MTQISLISEQWIPVRDRKGVVRKISPLEILDEEIVDIAAERGVPRVSGDEPPTRSGSYLVYLSSPRKRG